MLSQTALKRMKWENVCNFAHDSIFVAIHHSWLFVDRFDFIKAHKPYFYVAKVEKILCVALTYFFIVENKVTLSLIWKCFSESDGKMRLIRGKRPKSSSNWSAWILIKNFSQKIFRHAEYESARRDLNFLWDKSLSY